MQTLLPVTQAPKSSNASQAASSDNLASKNPENSNDKFDKILQREVSQKDVKTDYSKTKDSSKSMAESSDEASNITEKEQSTNSSVDRVLAITETKYQFDQTLNSAGIIPNGNLQLPISPISAELSAASAINDNGVGDDKSSQSMLTLLNSALLQKASTQSVQSTIDENSIARAQSNLLQSFNAASSADFGKIFPVNPDATQSFEAQLDSTLLASPVESTDHPLGGINTLATLTSPHVNNGSVHDIHVDAVVGQPKWGNEFAQKIVWMSNQQQQVAEIHLNPANLGPVEVMLSITQDQATAQFVSPHASVREAIQDALPRLKEMLADNGIQLGNVTVGAESSPQEHKQQQGYNLQKDSSDRTTLAAQALNTNEVVHTIPIQHHGMVNTFA